MCEDKHGHDNEDRHTRLRHVSRTAARSHLHGSRTRQTPQRAAQARFKFGRALPKSCPRIERKSQPHICGSLLLYIC